MVQVSLTTVLLLNIVAVIRTILTGRWKTMGGEEMTQRGRTIVRRSHAWLFPLVVTKFALPFPNVSQRRLTSEFWAWALPFNNGSRCVTSRVFGPFPVAHDSGKRSVESDPLYCEYGSVLPAEVYLSQSCPAPHHDA